MLKKNIWKLGKQFLLVLQNCLIAFKLFSIIDIDGEVMPNQRLFVEL